MACEPYLPWRAMFTISAAGYSQIARLLPVDYAFIGIRSVSAAIIGGKSMRTPTAHMDQRGWCWTLWLITAVALVAEFATHPFVLYPMSAGPLVMMIAMVLLVLLAPIRTVGRNRSLIILPVIVCGSLLMGPLIAGLGVAISSALAGAITRHRWSLTPPAAIYPLMAIVSGSVYEWMGYTTPARLGTWQDLAPVVAAALSALLVRWLALVLTSCQRPCSLRLMDMFMDLLSLIVVPLLLVHMRSSSHVNAMSLFVFTVAALWLTHVLVQMRLAQTQVQVLTSIQQHLINAFTLADVTPQFAQGLLRLIRFQRMVIWAPQHGEPEWRVVSMWSNATQDPEMPFVSVSKLACIAAQGAPVFGMTPASTPEGQHLHTLFMPLSGLEGCVALVRFDRPESMGPFTMDDVSRISVIIDYLAVTAQNVQLYQSERERAVIDELTQLLNYRGAQEALHRELHRSERAGSPLAALMIDVDHFKAFNDLHGHHAGDRLLQRIASRLRCEVRANDICGRIGGEEFLIVLPDTNLNGAMQIGERLRRAARDVRLSDDADPRSPGCTISVGVAAIESPPYRREALLQAADAALYRAKRMGRDRVVSASVPTVERQDTP